MNNEWNYPFHGGFFMRDQLRIWNANKIVG